MNFDLPQILSMMQRDPTGARAMLQASLAERAAADPALAMVMRAMSGRGVGESNGDESASREVVSDDDRRARSRARVMELRDALASAQELVADLAAALGACAACWGGTQNCATCSGRGAPGWRVPDEQLFESFVAPAIERRRRSQTTDRSHS